MLLQIAITLKIGISDPKLLKLLKSTFAFIFVSCLFTIFKINIHLQNTFWSYQHGVKYAYFHSYTHLNCSRIDFAQFEVKKFAIWTNSFNSKLQFQQKITLKSGQNINFNQTCAFRLHLAIFVKLMHSKSIVQQ